MLMRDEIIKIRKRAIKLKQRGLKSAHSGMFSLNNQWLTLVRAIVKHCDTRIEEAAYIQFETRELFEISFAMIKPVLLSVFFFLHCSHLGLDDSLLCGWWNGVGGFPVQLESFSSIPGLCLLGASSLLQAVSAKNVSSPCPWPSGEGRAKPPPSETCCSRGRNRDSK